MNRFSPLLLPLLVFTACYESPDAAAPAPDERPRASKNKHGIVVESVWEEESETDGKQHIAILEADAFTHSEHFLLFGKKNGKLSIRDFVATFLILDKPGNVESSKDNFYDFTARFVTEELMEVTLQGADGSEFNLVYKKINSKKVSTAAVAAAEKFYEKFEKLLASKVTKLADLKALIRLHQRSHDFGPNDDRALEWQFEIEDLQLEGELELTDANKKLAGVDIKLNGSDAISKLFKKKLGLDWSEEVPSAEEVLQDLGEESEVPQFLTFEKGISGVEPGPILDGLKKFAKFTITLSEPFECEDHFFEDHDFFWVLSDGSILSYLTSPECD